MNRPENHPARVDGNEEIMRGLIICTLICALTTALPAPARATFVVSPMELHLQASPGGGESASVTVRNTGHRPLLLKLYPSDSRFDTDGSEEEVPLGSLERSCAPWLTFDAAVLELAPGEARLVELRFAVPAGARGSYWTKLYIEEMSQPEPFRREIARRKYQVFIKQRMGVRLFADLPGTATREALVEKVETQAEERGRSYAVRVRNPGKTLLRCQGRVEIRDTRGEVVEAIKLGSNGEFLVFPGAARDLSASGESRLPPGTYTALAVVDFGGEHLVAGEEVFRVGGVPLASVGTPPLSTDTQAEGDE